MEIKLVTIGRRATARKHAAAEDLLSLYAQRIGHFCHFEIENYVTEEKFLSAMERHGVSKHGGKRELILLNSRSRSFSTEQFADSIRSRRDRGIGRLIFAVGPAGGWSEATCRSAQSMLSLGPMTLPHELAAVVLAEQIYRAFTILEGHPYHLGH